MDDVFQRIADGLPKVQEAIDRAASILRALREVGESNEALEQRLAELKARKARWEKMLSARGVSVSDNPSE